VFMQPFWWKTLSKQHMPNQKGHKPHQKTFKPPPEDIWEALPKNVRHDIIHDIFGWFWESCHLPFLWRRIHCLLLLPRKLILLWRSLHPLLLVPIMSLFGCYGSTIGLWPQRCVLFIPDLQVLISTVRFGRHTSSHFPSKLEAVGWDDSLRR